MSMTDREKAARAIGYLEGLSVFLWTIGESSSGISLCPEQVGYFDDQVEVLRKALFENESEESKNTSEKEES